jgi:hypothetical protein
MFWRGKENIMRKFLIALAAGTVLALAPMFAEQADAQRGRGGGIGRVGGVGVGGVGRIGGVGRVAGVGRIGGVGRVAGVGWGRPGWGHGGWGRRGGWCWGAPLAVGVGLGVGAAATCYRWDPYYQQYVNACGVPGYGYGYYGGQWW